MPLTARSQAFDDPDWIFELKHDGFRALAYVEGKCELVSRRRSVFSAGPTPDKRCRLNRYMQHLLLAGRVRLFVLSKDVPNLEVKPFLGMTPVAFLRSSASWATGRSRWGGTLFGFMENVN